jgi:hypothetical protein
LLCIRNQILPIKVFIRHPTKSATIGFGLLASYILSILNSAARCPQRVKRSSVPLYNTMWKNKVDKMLETNVQVKCTQIVYRSYFISSSMTFFLRVGSFLPAKCFHSGAATSVTIARTSVIKSN